ncbi:MAG: lipopolysaccharide heptosyltransferase family protein [Rhodospirillales bacterium]|nr:lipopolysaccharide heptosyltransferase family protein [Rhodospirillales bacterium]
MVKLFRLVDRYQRWRAKSRVRSGAPAGVLLLSAGGLGDTVLFSHVIEAFCRCAGKDEKITVLLRRDGARTGFLLPASVATLSVDFKRFHRDMRYRLEMSNQLYQANYRRVISTDYLRHPDLDEAMALAAQAPECIAMVARPWAKYQNRLDRNAGRFTRLFDSGPARHDKLLRWFRFASWISGEPAKPGLKRIKASVSAKAEPPLVLIQPFSAVKAKQLAPAVYGALIDALGDDVAVRITGAPGEMDANPPFKALLARPNVEFEDAGFEPLLALLQTARLVVSVDTAVMHLSVAAGAPTLCLASAAYVGEIVPYAPELQPSHVDFYYKSMDCEGCLGTCIKSLRGGAFPCIAELEPDVIIEKALKLFAGSAVS